MARPVLRPTVNLRIVQHYLETRWPATCRRGYTPFSSGQKNPDLPFLAFLEKKSKENHPKKQGFFLCVEPLKSLGKKEKHSKKTRKFLATKKSKEIQKGKERKIREQHKHKLSGLNFLRTFLTLTPGCPGVQKVSPHHRGRRKTHFLVRTSTIFGADVHDPKGS